MRRILCCASLALLSLLVAAPGAFAFGLTDLEVQSLAEGGGDATQAGSHPFAITTQVGVETEFDSGSGKVVPAEEVKDLDIAFPRGLVGNPTAVPQCPMPVFLAGEVGECEDASAVGVAEVEFGEPGKVVHIPLYNLEPTFGTAAKFGFIVEQRAPVTIDVGLNPDSPNNVVAHSTNVSQALFFFRAKVTVWGVPANPVHDEERGTCEFKGTGSCPSGLAEEIALLTLPTSCDSPLSYAFTADSWQNPGTFVEGEAAVGEPGVPLSPTGCESLGFEPEIEAAPTTGEASSASGLAFAIDVDDPGLSEPDQNAQSTIKRAEVTLPDGMVLNPSAAEGLGSCDQGTFFAETLASGPTCPGDSKIGSIEVETPLLKGELLTGSIYVATPYENPFGSLLALYMAIRDPQRGVLVKLPGKVVPDPATGRLTTIFGEAPYPVPSLPFSSFRFHFREGPRAPLITPPTCGPKAVSAVLYPSSGNPPLTETSTFEITSGAGGAPCPTGQQAFSPGLEAGSASPAAGAFSPFTLRLTRSAADQEITSLATVLPPGVTGKIAGLSQCSQAALAAAKSRSGATELALPSCSEDSLIGHIQSGAGTGSDLTWVSGRLYLAGPFAGAPLSVAAIVPAVAGPFDLGTVVVQEGLDLNPTTGEVEVRGGDVPRILEGVPLNLRDLRIATDRPGFTINPTDCSPFSTRASLTGLSGGQASPSAPYQASGCGPLAFKPKLTLRMKGATKRTGHPALSATVVPRAGDANIGSSTVMLPKAMFIDNAHINNPCTRVQFNEEKCPKGSILGQATAYTPLLDQPLSGPIYFRSNGGERELPDLVADLKGQFRITLVGFVDSKNERTRTRFLTVPDAPVSKFVLKLKGGKVGLLQNSKNLCARKQLAKVTLIGQNGRGSVRDQAIKVKSCTKKKKHKR